MFDLYSNFRISNICIIFNKTFSNQIIVKECEMNEYKMDQKKVVRIDQFLIYNIQ